MNWNDRRWTQPKATPAPKKRKGPRALPKAPAPEQARLIPLEETSPGYRAFKEMAARRNEERDSRG